MRDKVISLLRMFNATLTITHEIDSRCKIFFNAIVIII
jgi:hypothetical protein